MHIFKRGGLISNYVAYLSASMPSLKIVYFSTSIKVPIALNSSEYKNIVLSRQIQKTSIVEKI